MTPVTDALEGDVRLGTFRVADIDDLVSFHGDRFSPGLILGNGIDSSADKHVVRGLCKNQAGRQSRRGHN